MRAECLSRLDGLSTGLCRLKPIFMSRLLVLSRRKVRFRAHWPTSILFRRHLSPLVRRFWRLIARLGDYRAVVPQMTSSDPRSEARRGPVLRVPGAEVPHRTRVAVVRSGDAKEVGDAIDFGTRGPLPRFAAHSAATPCVGTPRSTISTGIELVSPAAPPSDGRPSRTRSVRKFDPRPHAESSYSWMSPPSRSCRRTPRR